MADLPPKLLKLAAVLLSAQGLIIAAVFGALCGRALRALLLVHHERGRGHLRNGGRFLAALLFCGLAGLYAVLTAAMMSWDSRAVLLAAGVAALMMSSVLVFQFLLRHPRRYSLVGLLTRGILILALFLSATLTLMRSGFLALTTDRPVLFVELTGETRPQTVRWAAPDQPLQEQTLRAHRVLLRAPDGTKGQAGGPIVAEAWLYGDEVAVKGRVLRLSPLLNAAGVSNLFELSFVHNGYFTAERHSLFPHQAQPLKPLGPLAVHPRFRPLRDWLLAHWERQDPKSDDPRGLAVVAATTESTYFPLVDARDQPLKHTYALVLTPGGLTANSQ